MFINNLFDDSPCVPQNYCYFLQLVFRNVSFRLVLIGNSIYFCMSYIVFCRYIYCSLFLSHTPVLSFP